MRLGNETIRVSPPGEVSVGLPAPHGRYLSAVKVSFVHQGPGT